MKKTKLRWMCKAIAVCCVASFAILTAFAGCSNRDEVASDSNANGEQTEQAVTPDAQGSSEFVASNNDAAAVVCEPAAPSENADFGDIFITFPGRKLHVSLLDNPTARELYNAAPFTIGFSDFNQTEKIGYPAHALSTQGSPDSCDPKPGDLCLYAPWGNLSLFYEDFRFSEGLIPLGHVIDGAEYLSEIQDGQMLTFEKAGE